MKRILGPGFLQISQQRIEPDDQQDCQGILWEALIQIGHRRRNGSNRQQHQQHDVADLVPEDSPRTAPSTQLNAIGPMLSQAGGDLGCGKAVFTAGEQALAFLSLQGMPGLSLRGKGQERLLAKRRNVKQKKRL